MESRRLEPGAAISYSEYVQQSPHCGLEFGSTQSYKARISAGRRSRRRRRRRRWRYGSCHMTCCPVGHGDTFPRVPRSTSLFDNHAEHRRRSYQREACYLKTARRRLDVHVKHGASSAASWRSLLRHGSQRQGYHRSHPAPGSIGQSLSLRNGLLSVHTWTWSLLPVVRLCHGARDPRISGEDRSETINQVSSGTCLLNESFYPRQGSLRSCRVSIVKFDSGSTDGVCLSLSIGTIHCSGSTASRFTMVTDSAE